MKGEIDSAFSKIPINASTEEKISYIYYYLINNCEYCDNSDDCNTAYAALVEKRGNCQGLSKAFLLLCNKADINAGYITGSYEDIPHMWNYVNIDGVEYQCDLSKGVEETEKYFLKVLFDDNRICDQHIDFFIEVQQ